jgi:hypothetical protein
VLDLRCVECNRRWDDVNERWRIYFTDDDPPEPVRYCAACAAREFDDWSAREMTLDLVIRISRPR